MDRRRNLTRMTSGSAMIAATIAVVALISVATNRTEEKLPDNLTLCLGQSKQANAKHDIERERRLLLHAETLSGWAEEAAEVQRRLAVLDWKYAQRFEEAQARLVRAAKNDAQPAEAWIALARMEQARENFAAAREAANRALESAESETDRREASLAAARASVAEAAALRRRGEIGATDALRHVFDELVARVREERGILEPSRLLLRAALLLDRGDAAIVAWHSYYRVAPGYPAPNAIAPAGEALDRILARWSGAEAASSDRIELVKALAGARFFDEAALVARDPRANDSVHQDPRVREILAYDRSLREIREETEEYYRQTILGEGDSRAYEKRIKTLLAPVLETMGIDPGGVSSETDLNARLGDRFGTYVSLGRTSGYFDLHMGHRVIDETRTVKQYGHQAELRFVALDSMVSNGFQSWAWESGAQHGGWAGPDSMWQVRPAYVDSAPEVWRKMHSEYEKAEFFSEMERESALDDDRARRDPYAFLSGLALRLEWQGAAGVKQRLERQGLEGEDLRLAFLAEYERSIQESSIFAHEGRHAIDKRSKKTKRTTWKSEYRAKLSEAVFTSDPRLALGSIFAPNIGDATHHGRANLQIMKDVVRWMERHGERIEGLDPARPLLPQFDLLTDEQIREVFRSVDPLAKAGS